MAAEAKESDVEMGGWLAFLKGVLKQGCPKEARLTQGGKGAPQL